MSKFVSKENLSYVWSKIKSLLGNKQDKITSSNKLSKDLVSGLGTASTVNTGTSNGNVPVIGTDGKLPSSVIPASAITDTFVESSQSAMLGLSSAEVGDVCVRTDLNKSFILKANPYSTLANWQELLTPTDAVTSVNGQTGAVSLSIPTGAAASKGVVTTVDTSANLPTSNAVKTFVEGKGYATSSSLSSYLPLSGGSLTGALNVNTSSGDTALYVKSASSGSYIGFKNSSGTLLGYYGVNSSKKPVFYDSGDKVLAYKSDIPTNNNQLTNGAGYVTSSGSVASATKATQDGSGNVITNTYVSQISKNQVGVTNPTANAVVNSVSFKNPSGTEIGSFIYSDYLAATTSLAGLMSAADKTKLDGLSSGGSVGMKLVWTGSLDYTSSTAASLIKSYFGTYSSLMLVMGSGSTGSGNSLSGVTAGGVMWGAKMSATDGTLYSFFGVTANLLATGVSYGKFSYASYSSGVEQAQNMSRVSYITEIYGVS